MTRIIMSGCSGAMGKMITDIVKEDSQAEIVAGIDIVDNGDTEYPVFSSIRDCNVEADAIIDFSTPKVLDDLLAYSEENKVPIVLCTTGYSEEQLAQIEKAAERTAILKSANMSLGINTLLKLIQDAAKVFATEGFDVEIVEKHHNQKVDAPSGTALALADSVNEAMGNQYEYIYDRSQRREKRGKKELGISAVRGGTIVGDHDVIFAGTDDLLESEKLIKAVRRLKERDR
ncbi:MAG: 4-hydroxy-tetrahydrodipicolinate reductase, partial [Eubacterium sp.]|nr:4-hydroxy-tetrahydrodipicolinate reductase [Eubacterium sp.]